MFSTTSASWWAFLTIHTQMGDIFYFVFLARGFFVGSKWPYGDMLIVFFIIPAEEGPHCHERRAGLREKMAAKKFKDETSSFNLKPPKFKLEMLGGKMVLARKTLYEMRTMINLTKLSYKWADTTAKMFVVETEYFSWKSSSWILTHVVVNSKQRDSLSWHHFSPHHKNSIWKTSN